MESHGALWAAAFGLQGDALAAQRERYERLKQHMVFQIDAAGITDPLTAFAAVNGSSSSSSSSWSQYFTDETLLDEINTDLVRLYPAGNESFFQNELYLSTLRHVLFVWCRLHPDVAYRQGMHDVVAVVLYAFLQTTKEGDTVVDQAEKLPEHAEADTFLVFEAVMLFLKPFYEIVKTRQDAARESDGGNRLFASFSLKENESGYGSYDEGAPKKQPALHLLCHHIQYELLQQKDPQLYYHLQNLEIVPETYCLRWIRLLFAREYALNDLLWIWDAMILDNSRAEVIFPVINMTDKSDNDLLQLPKLAKLCYANVETSMQRLVLSHDGSCLSHYISGKLFITNYRCFFTRLLGRGEIGWQIPVLSIASIDRIDPRENSTTGPATLSLENAQVALGFAPDDSFKVVIRCKDTQVARLSIADQSEYSKLVKCLSFLAFPKSLLDAFCFAYSPTVAPSEEVQFDIRQEYKRIGLLSFPEHLRCIDQSPTFTLCETYPRHLIVPADISDIRLKAAAAFRSHQRLPVVSWIHRSNGATIVRNKKAFGRYVIMDARSQLAAVGNKALGKGTEISSNYRGAKLIFMNVENIHSVRQSQLALAAIFEPKKSASEDTSSSFYGRIDSSGWLRHVRLVLKASVELAHTVHNGMSVLTHCSDGWDRTAQMVALAELMLDPYYRTLRGFQYPTECEFNERFLLTLADHVYSCKFGTFMFDCERQRKDFFAKHRVFSIWSEINTQSERFTNHMYAPSEQATVLSPSTLSKNIKLWKGYFCRWDPTVIPPVPASQSMALPPPPALAAIAAPWVMIFIFIVWGFFRGLSCSIPRTARPSKETKTLRVGFLHPDFGIGGAENLVVNAAVALQQRGAHVTVFTAHHDVNHCFEETRGDGPLAAHVRVHGDWLPRTILGKLYAFCAVVRVLFVTLSIAVSYINDVDVFVVDQVSISIPFLRALGKPVLFYGHFPDKLLCIRSDSPWKRLYRVPLDYLEEITTAASDIIVANSKFSRGVFQEVFPRLRSKKLGVLYPPVDVKAYKATAEADVQRDSGLFVSLNRFERKKNVALAIEALVELRTRLPSDEFQRVKLTVAGGYDPLNTENKEHLIELQDVAAKHGLEEHVEFRTSVSNFMKLELLRQAHAILYTPDREHFGIVPVEAMACGTPVIAVSSGGPLESIADGETGFLCEQKPEAFAEAMAELCGPKHSIRVVEMGACGRIRAQKLFSLETFGDTLLELVNQAVYGEKAA
ncbi:hypothetical protein JG688_00000515 [Phytophthora aleatoria]|uniref:GDP-Man:Man(1)GlcNAc(2)-PP-Dol alpha-1,3-mannosyltransferase n=1 Tax=Phytophthora aleatoria TaxID=2496075 RepID=A0A8J5J836_9STRA|nr:hypothetical protein JG688_00000515 [Phytophthora aleatoria]